MKDEIQMTFNQIVEAFDLEPARVRRWIERGVLAPVRREGTAPTSRMFFVRGEVSALIRAQCPVCGEIFTRKTLRQKYCSPRCRKRAHRMEKGRGYHAIVKPKRP